MKTFFVSFATALFVLPAPATTGYLMLAGIFGLVAVGVELIMESVTVLLVFIWRNLPPSFGMRKAIR
jgi:hypothetical protein